MEEESKHLPNAPLALVVLEVRFPELTEGITSSRRSAVREAVRDALPLVENVSEDLLQLGPNGISQTGRRTFPRFVTRDRTTALAINPGSAVLETTDYTTFEAFHELIRVCMQAVEDALEPDGIHRVGIRYIDEIRVPAITDVPGNWDGYIDEHLLATVAPDFLRLTELEPRAWQGLVQYSTGTDQILQLRYGPQDGFAVDPNGPTRRKKRIKPGPFFLLDSDSWWQPADEVPEFSADRIAEVCVQLHAPLSHVFKVISKKDLWDVYSQGVEAGT